MWGMNLASPSEAITLHNTTLCGIRYPWRLARLSSSDSFQTKNRSFNLLIPLAVPDLSITECLMNEQRLGSKTRNLCTIRPPLPGSRNSKNKPKPYSWMRSVVWCSNNHFAILTPLSEISLLIVPTIPLSKAAKPLSRCAMPTTLSLSKVICWLWQNNNTLWKSVGRAPYLKMHRFNLWR